VQSEKAPRIDPRVKRTRKLLQQAFAELLSEREFHNITVNDITERAEVNRATFYLHFDDKYALLSYSVREALQQLLSQRLPEANTANTLTLTNLRLMAVTVCEFMGQFFGHCRPGMRNDEQMLVAMQVQDYIQEILVEWITTTQGGAKIRPQAAEQAAIPLGWIIFGTVFESVRLQRKQTPEQIADQMLVFLAPSLQAYLTDLVRP
jgi:AcrR family transcriptional regulator